MATQGIAFRKNGEALSRATSGMSVSNYPTIYGGFTQKGIPESEITPRENVFTYNAWRALGRQVRRGEHGVKVLTFIDCQSKDEETGQLKQCNVSAVEDVIRQCWYIPRSGFHLVLVDEADRMSNAAQLQFLSKLDATAYPPQTIFVFTCNAIDGLEPRFLSRTRQLEFSSYGLASETIALLQAIWKREASDAPMPVFARIVKQSRNNVRDALMSLETELLRSLERSCALRKAIGKPARSCEACRTGHAGE